MKAKDLMTREVVTVPKDERIPNVLEIMRKRGVSKFPVTENGRLVGLLVDGDIADELGSVKNIGVATAHIHASSAMRRTVQTVTPETPLNELVYQMVEHNVGLMPVMHDSHVIGVVTASDLIGRITSDRAVGEFMTRNLHIVSPTDRVIHARRIMVDHHVERLPVLDNGALVGIVGEIDVAMGLWKFRETVANHRQAAQLKEFLIESIMRRQVITAPETTPAKDAARMMREHDVGSLPILRGDRLVGIITRSDLLRLLDV